MNIALNKDIYYITKILDKYTDISEDSILTLSKKSLRMVNNQQELTVFSTSKLWINAKSSTMNTVNDSGETERTNTFIEHTNTETGELQLIFINITTGIQHEVTPSDDPQ
jgi:hypothetical protein